MCHLMARVETKYFACFFYTCFLVDNGSVNSSATKGVVEDPAQGWLVSRLLKFLCATLHLFVALCMMPVGTSDSIPRGQIEGESLLL
jgi:hypothetical protein